jgi:nitrogen fixation-related uncharacterized protein
MLQGNFNQILLILYLLSILGTGVGIGFFFKGIRAEIKILSFQIEDLKRRLERIENKLIRNYEN